MARILICAGLVFVGGCSSMRSMQANMDTVTCNMGTIASHMPITAHNMRRMADVAERMEFRTNKALDAISAASPKAEPYLKAFLANDKAVIGCLKEIRGELAGLRRVLREADHPAETRGQARSYGQLSAKLKDLEARLEAVSSRVVKPEKKTRRRLNY